MEAMVLYCARQSETDLCSTKEFSIRAGVSRVCQPRKINWNYQLSIIGRNKRLTAWKLEKELANREAEKCLLVVRTGTFKQEG